MPNHNSFKTVPHGFRVHYVSRRKDRSVSDICERISPWWPLICMVAIGTACCLSGCQPESESTDGKTGIKVQLELQPTPPTTGDAEVVVTLTDSADNPVEGARIELEGNMNHAGMKPVFSTLSDAGKGKYEGTLNFTMGGDWFVLVSGELPDGTKVDEKVDVPGVTVQ